MARDFEVEEGQEVVRRTIVGGRPRARRKRRIRIPIGLEKVLCRAAGDEVFRETLLRDRAEAVAAAGYELQVSEGQVLDSVPVDMLAAMIGHIDVKRHGQGRFMRGIMAAAFAAAASTGSVACETDTNPSEEVAVHAEDAIQTAGIAPDVVDSIDPTSEGIRPDIIDAAEPGTDGIRPDIIEAPPDMTSRGAEPDLVDVGELMPAGILPEDISEPDVIDVGMPAPGGILPDAE